MQELETYYRSQDFLGLPLVLVFIDGFLALAKNEEDIKHVLNQLELNLVELELTYKRKASNAIIETGIRCKMEKHTDKLKCPRTYRTRNFNTRETVKKRKETTYRVTGTLLRFAEKD